jgi:hypothetical protein
METVANHAHLFEPMDWPFDAPTNALAYTNQRVLREGHPVLLVGHDDDSDGSFCVEMKIQASVSSFALGAHLSEIEPLAWLRTCPPVGKHGVNQ